MSEYKKKMKKLNDSFLHFMESHLSSNWKEACLDYMRYSRDLSAKYDVDDKDPGALDTPPLGDRERQGRNAVASLFSSKPLASKVSSSSSSGSSGAVGLGMSGSASSSSSSSKNAQSAGSGLGQGAHFKFGSNQASATKSDVAVKPPPFTFGGPAAGALSAAAAAKPAFGFGSGGFGGAPAGSGAPSSGGFGAGKAAAEGGDDEEGEEVMEPEKVHKNTADTSVDVKVEAPCKLLKLNDSAKEWVDMGKGSFSIVQDTDTAARRRMLVRNPMGKILVNTYFTSGQKFEKASAGQIRFVAVVEEGKDKQMNPRYFCLKLKKESVDKILSMAQAAVEEA
jgi:hypothetical protein